jgi:hypothetical protein
VRVIYPAGKELLLRGGVDFMVDTIKVAMVGTYTYDATDTTIADVAGIIGTAQIVSVNAVTGGVVTIDDVIFADVGGIAHVTGLVAYRDGTPFPLLAYANQRADTIPIDVAPTGGDITFSFDHLMKI